MVAAARDPRQLVVRNDEPGFLGCRLHHYWASFWMAEGGDAYHEHPYGEGVTSKVKPNGKHSLQTKHKDDVIQWMVEIQDASTRYFTKDAK